MRPLGSGTPGSTRPGPVELRFEVIGPVHQPGGVGVLAADLVQREEEGVVGELLRGDPGEAGEVGGGSPALELGGALRVDHTVDGPDGEEDARACLPFTRTLRARSVDPELCR